MTCPFSVRPLSVEIMFPNQPLSSERGYEVDCEAVGSRPPAKITWWMDGVELKSHSQKVSALFASWTTLKPSVVSFT